MDDRERIREALLDLCAEQSVPEVTIDAICGRAGLPRQKFDGLYTGLEDCVVQIDQGEYERYERELAAAVKGKSSWRDRLRATAYALYRFMAADERVWKFVVVEVRIAGEQSRLLQGDQIAAHFDLIDEGRLEPTAPASLTRATAESVGGGIFNRIFATVGQGEPIPPEPEIVPQLMYGAVLPYLGPEVAKEELTIPAPPHPGPT
jgi:AcrR family transcriptional regulator